MNPSKITIVRIWRFTSALVLSALVLGNTSAEALPGHTEFCAFDSPDSKVSIRKKPTEKNGSNVLITLYNGDCGIWIAQSKPARSGPFVRARVGTKSGWVKSKWLKRAVDIGNDSYVPSPVRSPVVSSSGIEPALAQRLDDHSARYGAALEALSDFAYKTFISGTPSIFTFYCDSDYSASGKDAWLKSGAYRALKATASMDESERKFIFLCQQVIDIKDEDVVG